MRSVIVKTAKYHVSSLRQHGCHNISEHNMIWRIYIIEYKVLVASNQHISPTAGQSYQVQTQETGDSREVSAMLGFPFSRYF